MKPIIGIVEWPYRDLDGDVIYEILLPIIEWVILSGGRPIGLFPSQIDDFVNKRLKDIRELNELEQQDLYSSLALCDGIIKPGALKIYNHEQKIYEYCYKFDVPYLGICAGMQTMAYYNMKIQNEKNNSNIIHNSKDLYSHKILIKDNTLLHRMFKVDEIMVNSHHNYHISSSGIHKISAIALDDVIEAIEASNKDFQIGVQWHPELLPKSDPYSQILFGEFVQASKQYQKRK